MQLNYSVLAKYYDKFTQNDCDYESWSQYLYGVAMRCNAREVVDIACGTGKMTKLLVSRGLKVIGVDQSAEMLNVAREKCRASFVQQDMRKLSLPHPVDVAICVNDGVNYLKPSELTPFFTRVASVLKQGAPFVFDVSSAYKLTHTIGNNVFYLDDERETLLWSNSVSGNSVEMNLTLFTQNDSGAYDRFDERHVQYLHTSQAIEQCLGEAGFELREITSEYGQELSENSLRLTFYALKK